MTHTIRRYGSILLFFLAVLSFASCKSTEEALAGKWEYESDRDWSVTLTLNEDGTGKITYKEGSKRSWKIKWELADDEHIKFTNFFGNDNTDKIKFKLSNGDKTLTLYDLDDDDMAELDFEKID